MHTLAPDAALAPDDNEEFKGSALPAPAERVARALGCSWAQLRLR